MSPFIVYSYAILVFCSNLRTFERENRSPKGPKRKKEPATSFCIYELLLDERTSSLNEVAHLLTSLGMQCARAGKWKSPDALERMLFTEINKEPKAWHPWQRPAGTSYIKDCFASFLFRLWASLFFYMNIRAHTQMHWWEHGEQEASFPSEEFDWAWMYYMVPLDASSSPGSSLPWW